MVISEDYIIKIEFGSAMFLSPDTTLSHHANINTVLTVEVALDEQEHVAGLLLAVRAAGIREPLAALLLVCYLLHDVHSCCW